MCSAGGHSCSKIAATLSHEQMPDLQPCTAQAFTAGLKNAASTHSTADGILMQDLYLIQYMQSLLHCDLLL